MFQKLIKSGMLLTTLMSLSGCLMCGMDPCGTCQPCGSCQPCGPYLPWDSQYCGAVETGPLGTPRPYLAQRREMRRALKNQYGFNACPTCSSGFDGGMMYDAPQQFGGAEPSVQGGFCPTCQQQQYAPSMMGMPSHNHGYENQGFESHGDYAPGMMVPTPMPQESTVPPTGPVPTPTHPPAMAPAPVLGPATTPPSTTYYQQGLQSPQSFAMQATPHAPMNPVPYNPVQQVQAYPGQTASGQMVPGQSYQVQAYPTQAASAVPAGYPNTPAPPIQTFDQYNRQPVQQTLYAP